MRKLRKHIHKVNKARKKEKPKSLKVYTYKCGRKNIRLTVENVELVKKTILADSIFFYRCAFCDKDYDTDILICPQCYRNLAKVNLKKCPECGAKNNPEKEICWVCGAAFPKLEQKIDKENQILLTLKIDERYYRNTDKLLGFGIRKLFDDLIASNFNKETMDAWVKKYEGESDFIKESVKEECKYISQESQKRNLMTVIGIILIIGIFAMITVVFWAK